MPLDKYIAPKPNTEFRRHNGRLALFHEVDDACDYWDAYWDDKKRTRLVGEGAEGDLGEFETLIDQYVPQSLPVLEAGCGPAHLVLALQQRGYQVAGIDYEPDVVGFVQEAMPDLDVREGNVLALNFEDGSLGCYLSVGVVEHFEKGPQQALSEARRVLHPEGVALISVPYLSPARAALLAQLSEGDIQRDDLHFHQYYFSIEEFSALLLKAGLYAIKWYPYAVEAYLRREHPFFSRLWHSPLMRECLKWPLRQWFLAAPTWLRRRAGHMIMFVCKPVL